MKKLIITVLFMTMLNLTLFSQWITSGSNIYNTNNGNVGIGNTTPTSKLDIIGLGSTNANLITTRNNWSNAMIAFAAGDLNYLHATFSAQRSRGTWQNPTSVLPGDRLGSFGANGYSGSTYSTQGAMEMYAGTNLGTYIIFGTTLTPGSSRLERVRISENGNVGIGFTGPSQKLDVNGSVRGVSFLSFSDERFKTNIRKVEHALDQLVKIEGVRYQFNQQKYSGRSFHLENETDSWLNKFKKFSLK